MTPVEVEELELEELDEVRLLLLRSAVVSTLLLEILLTSSPIWSSSSSSKISETLAELMEAELTLVEGELRRPPNISGLTEPLSSVILILGGEMAK